ncbi:unnamed protein product [Withania somnifera]
MDKDGGNTAEKLGSDPNPCPICLASVTEESYLDQCFHKFCYGCILRWIKVVTTKHSAAPSSVKCPLCKKYLQPNRWLISWLRREIQALTQEEDVDVIVHHILGVVDSFRRNEQKQIKVTPRAKQEEFKIMVSEAAKPFLTGRTDRFVNELKLFRASSLTIDAFDRVYIQHLGWKIPKMVGEGEEGEPVERAPLVPYLYFFDEDCDGNE